MLNNRYEKIDGIMQVILFVAKSHYTSRNQQVPLSNFLRRQQAIRAVPVRNSYTS